MKNLETNSKSEIQNPHSALPRWQAISGLTPQRETEMSDAQRDEAIRKLLSEVERIANAEFARGETIPANERTVLWDPIERVCLKLEISRTKLSEVSRELTGMRAHEITDRIKAKDLFEKMTARMMRVFWPELSKLIGNVDVERFDDDEKYYMQWEAKIRRMVKNERRGFRRGRWAADLGFANPARLVRACLLAHGGSVEEMEELAISQLVQKFSREVKSKAAARSTNNEKSKTLAPKPAEIEEVSPEDSAKRAESEKLIDQIAKEVVRGRNRVA